MQTNAGKYIHSFKENKILIIGDMVADVYLEGKISRISREAPVLVLEHLDEKVFPGGAANAVNNVAALKGEAYAVGVIGADFAGSELSKTLRNKGVNVEGFVVDENRPTITKTRIMAGGQATVRQQIVRIDKEKREPLSLEVEEKVIAYISEKMPHMDAVIMSDYGSHTVTPKLRETIINGCKRQQIPCIVDSRYNIMEYIGVSVVKQNESELAAAVGYPVEDQESLSQAGMTVLKALDAQAVLITRGPDGMTLFEQNGDVTHIPVTNKSEVYDVTGAGDTVVATLILALSAGVPMVEAAKLSNFAAGIVVRKLGTATTTPTELENAILNYKM